MSFKEAHRHLRRMTHLRIIKRSYSASSSSLSGSSLEAPIKHRSGTGFRLEPLSNARSFNRVNKEFKILELACAASSDAGLLRRISGHTLKISSMKATSASGK